MNPSIIIEKLDIALGDKLPIIRVQIDTSKADLPVSLSQETEAGVSRITITNDDIPTIIEALQFIYIES